MLPSSLWGLVKRSIGKSAAIKVKYFKSRAALAAMRPITAKKLFEELFFRNKL